MQLLRVHLIKRTFTACCLVAAHTCAAQLRSLNFVQRAAQLCTAGAHSTAHKENIERAHVAKRMPLCKIERVYLHRLSK